MQLNDERIIKADPATVWAAILDPEVLRRCIPGCESLSGSVAEGFEAVVSQKVGPVSARFSGIVALSDVMAPHSLTISGEGKGGIAGFAKGGAHVSFAPEGEGTRLTYSAEAKVGGKIAQLGSRIIDSFARKLADEFFQRFQDAVEGPETEEEDVSEDNDEKPKKGWFRRLIS